MASDEHLRALHEAKVEAWERWADAVRRATHELCSSNAMQKAKPDPGNVNDGVFGLSETDSLVPEIVNRLLDHVVIACHRSEWAEPAEFSFAPDEVDELRALRDRTRSAVYGQKSAGVVLAVEIVKDALEQIRRWDAGETKPKAGDPPGHLGWPPRACAVIMVHQLSRRVHPGFSALRLRSSNVLSILLRYEADPHRRRTKRGVPGKLGIDGIVSALNKLSGSPLGVGELTANAVFNARTRGSKPHH